MGISKTNLFSNSQNKLALLAKAFAHPARIAIIEYLLNAKACVNGDLVEEIGLAQATISQHLKELKSIGIIQGTVEGVSMSYCINPDKWGELTEAFNGIFNRYEHSKPSKCC